MQETKEDKDFKHLVRIANTDLNGAKSIITALRNIKGINFMFSNIVCHLAKIDPKKRAGELLDQEVAKINDIISDPPKFGIPSWMLNRRKDYESGTDKHLLTADLTFANENDIKTMKKIKSYCGMRHMIGQPVRGQKTKNNFRANKGKVHLGVKKKAGAKSGRP